MYFDEFDTNVSRDKVRLLERKVKRLQDGMEQMHKFMVVTINGLSEEEQIKMIESDPIYYSFITEPSEAVQSFFDFKYKL